MKFTKDYINLCLQSRNLLEIFKARYGDWYGNTQTRKVLVYTEPGRKPFAGEEFFFVPDLNDLVRLIRLQAANIQKTETPIVDLNLSSNAAGRWDLAIVMEGSITDIMDVESAHEALLRGLMQLIVLGGQKKESTN